MMLETAGQEGPMMQPQPEAEGPEASWRVSSESMNLKAEEYGI
jgi:hypothetical protein